MREYSSVCVGVCERGRVSTEREGERQRERERGNERNRCGDILFHPRIIINNLHFCLLTSSLQVPTKTMPRDRAARETSVMSAPSVLAATGTKSSINSSRWDPKREREREGDGERK